ncbi:FAD-dependent oxidoreductase [Streptomyces cavernicola]|uniref:FAD-dependent oxidoreductase n=1 Tax=Streptomyces cavernicola TaxID=3043613 RepID=A0ABT6SKY8_9ACTN|nr:FAD-dependent oxidoreductase [Streptomyces sp. B-S-A6]MDI3408860.1 FAD-dependent oxidoreductase [Streptomyces sp. B-S-A6]
MNGSTSTGAHTVTSTHANPHTDPGTEASVLVVGAGPTGLLLAGDLAAAGIPVTVLEKRPAAISNLTRAFGVHARTLEQLDARGLADELVAQGQRIETIRLFGDLTLDVSALRSRFPFLLSTPQYEVEKLLRRRATEHGVTFRHGTEVTGLRQDATGVEVEVRHEDGITASLRAAYLVGADGVRSTVREAIGQSFPGRPVISSIVLADVELPEDPERTVAVSGSKDAFAFVIPFGDGYWRVGGWNRERADIPDSAPTSLDELKDIARRAFGSDLGMHDARWISRFHSDERQVRSYRTGRVFLAGDAAHTHSPAGGQGMNTGLQDAANLSWKLAAILRGRAPEALLDTYQSERHPVGRTVLRSSGAIVRLAMAHNRPQYALRSLLTAVLKHVRPAREKALGQITGIGYAYAAPRGTHPLVGHRAPDLALAESPAGTRLHEALRAGEFVLVTPADVQIEAKDGKGHELRATLTHWSGPRRTALLVRPDGYIAWAAENAHPEQILAAVRERTEA